MTESGKAWMWSVARLGVGVRGCFLVGFQPTLHAAMGNPTTFQPTAGGALFNAGVAGVLSPLVGIKFPVANNTISTLKQASHFIPGRKISLCYPLSMPELYIHSH